MKRPLDPNYNCRTCRKMIELAGRISCTYRTAEEIETDPSACKYYSLKRENTPLPPLEKKKPAAADGENMSIFDFI